MTEGCPHLDYRAGTDGTEFEVPRAYCTVAERFVQPVRADVCNERYDLSPAEHCEIYREHEGIEDSWLTGEATDVADGSGDAANRSGDAANRSGDDAGGGSTDR